MSAAPEEFLAQGAAYLAAPEPFSPSVFLDLPPTPRTDADGDDPDASDDLVLPFISRMLMEEDIDDKFFYQFPDHPALLNAQQPYAQILSDATTTSDGSNSNSNSSGTAAASSTLSPSSSSDAPASSAEPAWPYDPADLLRSPDMGVGLDDFTADDVDAALLLQGQQDAAFHHSPPFLDTGGGGLPPQPAAQNAGGDGSQRQRHSFAAHNAAGIRSSAVDEQETKTANPTAALPAADTDHAALASAFFSAQNGESMDMLNTAFLKGMEEAKKFLPASNSLLVDLEATSGQSTDSKPATGFPAGRVKEEEVADGMYCLEVEALMAGAARTAMPKRIWRQRRAEAAS